MAHVTTDSIGAASETTQARLRALIRALQLNGAARLLRTSRLSVAAIACGATTRRGTVLQVEQRLRELEATGLVTFDTAT